MSFEFKKLSEVTLLDTVSDNATVLVEDSGEIKRVPKKEVGGAGGYVIYLSESYLNDDGDYQIDSNYDELYDVLQAGGAVWIDYADAPSPASMPNPSYATNCSSSHMVAVAWFITDIGLFLYNVEGKSIYYPNGSHNLESAPK